MLVFTVVLRCIYPICTFAESSALNQWIILKSIWFNWLGVSKSSILRRFSVNECVDELYSNKLTCTDVR